MGETKKIEERLTHLQPDRDRWTRHQEVKELVDLLEKKLIWHRFYEAKDLYAAKKDEYKEAVNTFNALSNVDGELTKEKEEFEARSHKMAKEMQRLRGECKSTSKILEEEQGNIQKVEDKIGEEQVWFHVV